MTLKERFEKIDKLLADAEILHERLKQLTATAHVVDNINRNDVGERQISETSSTQDYIDNLENCSPPSIITDELSKPSKQHV